VIIVSTRPDGGVSLTRPTNEIMSILTLGGAEDCYSGRVDWDAQIANHVRDGIREVVAVRWIKHFRSGGLTDAEAYELIRDRDTKPEWSGKELWKPSEAPIDRWFRNAWKRSHNGGPIYIAIDRAKPIQFKHIVSAIEREKKRRSNEMDYFDIPVEVDLLAIREKIRRASDEIELRHIWPDGLNS
jgi:hypothetical protein